MSTRFTSVTGRINSKKRKLRYAPITTETLSKKQGTTPRALSRTMAQRRKCMFPAVMCDGNIYLRDTSVADGAGKGIYAARAFDSGTRIGITYPGVKSSISQYDKLNTTLFMWAQAFEEGDERGDAEERVKLLRDDFNFHIRKRYHEHSDGPNWPAIYDSFVSYVFSATSDITIYWNHFEWESGDLICPRDDLSAMDPTLCAGLFTNEPPDCEMFFNVLLKTEQTSCVNAMVKWSDRRQELEFWSTRKIKRHEEILISYGPFYNRNYPINYNSIVVPDLTSVENGDLEKVQKCLEIKANYKPATNVFKRGKK